MTSPQVVPAEALAGLAELVEATSGLRFVGGRNGELASKAARVFADSGYPTWEAYLRQLASPSGAASLRQMVEALTVGETYFYRHRAYFELLEQEILPAIVARRRTTRHLRLWCAGCATGEEAYSLAIAVQRALPSLSDWQVSILATDLNRGFLARAEAGLYSEWSFRETDAAFKSTYFIAEGRGHRVRPELRKLVRFAYLNLVEDAYPSTAGGTAAVDLVMCRNVLLYFGEDLAHRIVDRLRAALVPGGWLILGPSDPRPGLMAEFEIHAREAAVVYRRKEDDEAAPVAAGARTVCQAGRPVPIEPLELVDPPAPRQPKVVPALAPPAANVPSPTESALDWREAWRAARASANQGQLDLAEWYCQQAIAAAQLRPEPHYLFGALRQARGDDEAALAAFRRALYVDPTFAPALLGQAAIQRRGGAEERARHALLRAQRLLNGRQADEWVLAEEGLTVGRLRDAVAQALDNEGLVA